MEPAKISVCGNVPNMVSIGLTSSKNHLLSIQQKIDGK